MTKPRIVFYLFVCFLLQSCYPWGTEEPVWQSAYEPVFMSRTDLDNDIELKSAQDMVSSGKIYVKGDLLFIGEKGKGFHVFDNSDLQNPVKTNFIQVLGCTDIAVRNDIMYINQATDLVTLRFNEADETLALVKRVENVFPELRSPEGEIAYSIPDNNIVVDWKLKN